MQIDGSETDTSLYADLLLWVARTQAELHQSLVAGVSAVRESAASGATESGAVLGLMALGFGYGLFHAAGPGHGKAVLAGWLSANPSSLKRGVGLAMGGAMIQGLVAIALVGGLVTLAGLLPSDVTDAVTWSERVSYALVAGLGGLLLVSAGRALWHAWRDRAQDRAQGRGAGDKDGQEGQEEHHAQCSSCGHSHAPDAAHIKSAEAGPLALLAVMLSMGLRPCTGAILLLIFSTLAGILWVGIVSVLAMSLGTAIAVAALAIVTVKARDLAMRLATRKNLSALPALLSLFKAGIGGLLLLIGLSLLASSFAPSGHALGL
ncbi:MAG: membrane protein [Alphaproteobacteria bacterium]